MARFGLNLKDLLFHVIWEKQDQIWAKRFCISKNMHSRSLMVVLKNAKHLTL